MFLQCPLIYLSALFPFSFFPIVVLRNPGAAGKKWISPGATCTTRIAKQSLTTFTFHLLCETGHHFPPLLPEKWQLLLPKVHPCSVALGEVPPWRVPLSHLCPHLSLSCSNGIMEIPLRQAELPQIFSCLWVSPIFAISRFFFPQLW